MLRIVGNMRIDAAGKLLKYIVGVCGHPSEAIDIMIAER